MEDEETIRPRWDYRYDLKTLAALPFGLAMVFGGVLGILQGDWIGLLVILFGILAATVGFLHLQSRGNALRLHADGFTVREGRHEQTYRWVDVTEFGVGKLGGETIIGFDFAPSYHANPDGRAALKGEIDFECYLPNGLGKRPKELVALLNRRRADALRQVSNAI